MPDRRGEAVLDDLPDDVIVGKILILLPTKDIGRCRVVRTAWRSATSTPEFMVEHRRRQPSLPIVDGKGRPASFVALRAARRSGPSSPGAARFASSPRAMVSGSGYIIVFDTETELFRRMRTSTRRSSRLFNMEGTLACIDKAYTTMDVWVIKDYEAESWAFKYRIDRSMIKASQPLDLTSREEECLTVMLGFFEMAVLNERELLVDFDGQHVLRCDTDSKFLGMVTIGKKQYCMRLTGHRHQESIMPIPSGEMQGEDEEFPFST